MKALRLQLPGSCSFYFQTMNPPLTSSLSLSHTLSLIFSPIPRAAARAYARTYSGTAAATVVRSSLRVARSRLFRIVSGYRFSTGVCWLCRTARARATWAQSARAGIGRGLWSTRGAPSGAAKPVYKRPWSTIGYNPTAACARATSDLVYKVQFLCCNSSNVYARRGRSRHHTSNRLGAYNVTSRRFTIPGFRLLPRRR